MGAPADVVVAAPGSERARERGLRAVDGDEEFAGFFRREYPHVRRTVWLIVRDAGRAEEIAQDAFVELFARWRRIARYERPEAWVRRVAIRMAVRFVRREHARSALERAAAPAPPRPDGLDLDVLRAVAELPAMQRAAVVLHYLEDRAVDDVAEFLGCSSGSVKVHLYRARKRLGRVLAEEVVDGA